MKHKKKYCRFLWMLLPLVPALALSTVAGFRFSVFLLACMSLLVGIFCVLSLCRGKAAEITSRVLSVLVILGILVYAGTEAYLLAESRADSEKCDYLVVLGAGVNGTRPSLMLQDRIRAAYAYLSENPDTVCIVSGGQGENEDISEAACMFRELTHMGIDPARILREERAVNTSENLRFSMDLLEETTGTRPRVLGILSNEFHLPRARLMAQDLGITPVAIPADTSWVSLKINYYLREAAALWKYLLFGGN